MTGGILERTSLAIARQILESPARGRPAKTIFFGGGTPTFLEKGDLLRVFDAVLRAHPPLEGCEITSEANPGTVDIPKFEAMRRAGFNRISLGAQSFQDSDLTTLGRVHRASEIERAVGAAREAGFDNLNLDLMFGLPDQSIHAWRRNLERAIALAPEHLSLYCLTIEPNTPFYKLDQKGLLPLPDDESQVTMYDACVANTLAAGYEQYEISNFAKPGFECRHNLCYWQAEEYAGYGPGAVGCLDDGAGPVRYTNLKHPEGYCTAVEQGRSPAFEAERLTVEALRTEKIMLGLRMNRGVAATPLGLSPASVERLLGRDWVVLDGDTIRLTAAGRHFCSEVALELI